MPSFAFRPRFRCPFAVPPVARVPRRASPSPPSCSSAVGTGEVEGTDPTLVITNTLAKPVNVYVRAPGSTEIFLRQIPGAITETIPVRGLGVGSAVTLRAAPVDGSVSYTRDGVVLARGVTWRLP